MPEPPTEAEIRERALAIQATWSADDRFKRMGGRAEETKRRQREANRDKLPLRIRKRRR